LTRRAAAKMMLSPPGLQSMWHLPFATLLFLQASGAPAAPAARAEAAQPVRAFVPARLISGRLTSRDYPLEAWNRGAAGRSTVRYLIDVDGTVPACEIAASSGHAVLDTAACRIIQERFRFAPAKDSQGRRSQEIRTQNVEWMLPDGRPRLPGGAAGPVIDASTAEYLALRGARPAREIPGTLQMPYPVAAFAARQSGTTEARLIVGPSGTVTDCAIARSSGHAALDAHTCRMAMATARFFPAQDDAGNPVAAEHVLTVPWRLRSGGRLTP
jgi:TonB family protein